MKRVKPDLSSGRGGMVDPEFILSDVRKNLMLSLVHSPLNDDQKSALLDYANDIGQMVMDGELKSGKEQREQIEKVAADAHRLLSSLKMMSEPARDALHAHTDYLAYGSDPPVDLDHHIKTQIKDPRTTLLSSSWDWITALEVAANYSAEQFKIDKTSKPGQMRARGLVAMLAERVRELTGSKPPKDPASWFAGFAECLGEHLEPKMTGPKMIGPRIIKSGIEAIR